jgi:dihydrofolate reductase
MDGGTTFHFVTDGIHVALKRAREAANGQDVRLGGGVAVIRQSGPYRMDMQAVDFPATHHKRRAGKFLRFHRKKEIFVSWQGDKVFT